MVLLGWDYWLGWYYWDGIIGWDGRWLSTIPKMPMHFRKV